ncbi:ESX secretion-associated protein EspG [Amycolatopsis xylanica]|nr:ESX secretion-associated protein EspG [Amycolatopsis xylanica]
MGTVEATVVGRAFGVDVRSFPLRIRNTTAEPERFARLARQVDEVLTADGLAAGGKLDPAVITAFELWSRPHVSVSVSGIDGLGDDIAVLAFTDGARALGVTQAAHGDTLDFALFTDEQFAEVIAGVLPRMPAAATGSYTVRRQAEQRVSAMTARRRAARELEEDEDEAFGSVRFTGAVRSGVGEPRAPRSDEETLTELMAGARLGGGRIVVTGARGAASPLTWLDTEHGRFLIDVEEDAGTFIAHYSPAGFADLVAAIRRRIAGVY